MACGGTVGSAEISCSLYSRYQVMTKHSLLCLFVCCSSAESPKCGNNNEPLDKEAAVLILDRLLESG